MGVASATKRRTAANLFRHLATGVLVAAALVAARYGWRVYVTSPWTRDGMVRVQVANVASQISGQIVGCEPPTTSMSTRGIYSTLSKNLISR